MSRPGAPALFTPEQVHAIERRAGDMLLDAGAGSGKTTVLVERFARAVLEDGIDVGALLTITFTEKAAAELRERVRARLREASADGAAFATEGAWISTIHGFCARVLRTHALAAGLDPNFTVLDEQEAAELRDAALEAALAELARGERGADLIAAYGPRLLRTAIIRTHSELRARGQLDPQLPTGAHTQDARLEARSRAESCRTELLQLASAVGGELAQNAEPGKQVLLAMAAVQRAARMLAGGVPWPGELDRIRLPGGNAKALQSDACARYSSTLEELRRLTAEDHALTTADTLDALLRGYGKRYTDLKRERSQLDFEDLELLAREVLRREEIGRRYRERFTRVMVDEMQDTNRVQLELIDLVSNGGLFMVGDAQQSIYGFRHADVALFEERGRELAKVGARASLQTNFRSRAGILTALNAAFGRALGEQFRPLLPSPAERGRMEALKEPAADAIRESVDENLGEPPSEAPPEPLVELLIVDRDAVTAGDDPDPPAAAGSATVWRLAEARALAARVGDLVAGGAATPGEVVVLMRATTDIQLYDRALAEAGLPTYVIGGRGYWEQQQVIQLICYLRALANPLDQEAWQTTLLSPLCGLSLDGIVMLAAGAGDQLAAGDRVRLDRFESWFAQERAVAARLGPELLLEQALERSGYEIAVVSLPDGRRRLANVRKLMRLARDWENAHGADLQGFLRLIRTRATADGVRESEAPVEGESLDAVRLMTIHRSKGLEFPVVCVADLGRQKANTGGGLIRIGRDGLRLGLQIRRPGGGGRVNALCYDELREEQRELEDAEERRLFYVAMTRARDRLIVSGAATFNDWDDGNRAAPIGWVGAAFVPDIGARAQAGAETFITDLGVRVSLVSSVPFPDSPKLRAAPASSQTPGPSEPAEPPEPASSQTPGPSEPAEPPEPARLPQQLSLDLQLAPQTESAGRPGPRQPEPAARPGPAPRLSTLSYTSLSTYERCGYRFYIEHVLRFPAACALPPAPAAARGTEIHAILAQLDLRGPKIPPHTPPDVQRLISRFLASSSFRRLAALPDPRREQQFAFGFKDILITGTFDLLARDPRGGALVVDYKSDHLGDRDPAAVAAQDYGLQRTVYALAALRIGAGTVEVLHLFLERPQEPAVATYTASDRPALEAELAQHVAGPLAGDFAVTGTPGRRTCSGCPARGGLCSWPLAETER